MLLTFKHHSDFVLFFSIFVFLFFFYVPGRAANAVALASNTIRWTMGPTGTTVTFSEDIGLPNIFNHVPSRYESICFSCHSNTPFEFSAIYHTCTSLDEFFAIYCVNYQLSTTT